MTITVGQDGRVRLEIKGRVFVAVPEIIASSCKTCAFHRTSLGYRCGQAMDTLRTHYIEKRGFVYAGGCSYENTIFIADDEESWAEYLKAKIDQT